MRNPRGELLGRGSAPRRDSITERGTQKDIMADEAINVLRQALAATQSADSTQRKQGDF